MKDALDGSRDIVSDLDAKCQYFVISVLNQDLFYESGRELRCEYLVVLRASFALPSVMTEMQNIIILYTKQLFKCIRTYDILSPADIRFH